MQGRCALDELGCGTLWVADALQGFISTLRHKAGHTSTNCAALNSQRWLRQLALCTLETAIVATEGAQPMCAVQQAMQPAWGTM